jgi:hypothetical protein
MVLYNILSQIISCEHSEFYLSQLLSRDAVPIIERLNFIISGGDDVDWFASGGQEAGGPLSALWSRHTAVSGKQGIVSKFNFVQLRYYTATYTDKKGTKIFLINKEIQNGAVAKSYITNGLLMEIFRISSNIRKSFLIHVYDFATAPF